MDTEPKCWVAEIHTEIHERRTVRVAAPDEATARKLIDQAIPYTPPRDRAVYRHVVQRLAEDSQAVLRFYHVKLWCDTLEVADTVVRAVGELDAFYQAYNTKWDDRLDGCCRHTVEQIDESEAICLVTDEAELAALGIKLDDADHDDRIEDPQDA